MNPIDHASLDRLFREGRTFNHYLDTPVGEDEIHVLWDLMKMGPTSTNQMPARLVWCLSQDAKDKLADCATGSNAEKIRAAPAAVVIGMDVNFHENLPQLFPHVDAKSWFDGNTELREASAFRNSSLQGAYLILAARALGLDTGAMSGFDQGAVDKAFFADQPGVRSNFIATLGYGDRSTLHPRNPRLAFEQANRIV
ncbi:nitroreductase family protein [Sphingomonas sp. S17]|jgi:3-hydroxypropanoate dehydrogenase|nr:nitroreductase family protein [Sphingomonas sp. S17]MDG5970658.1 malonic semialdehyde reductase [Sphingomonas paucimobilis]BCI72264.1 putative NADH dehydrogenase/NAD(P)H nitroreductase [Sphingomonas paucimobilis]GAN15471.1 putative nitroreductase [Sphingomonas paucimobilis NBRC 13935]